MEKIEGDFEEKSIVLRRLVDTMSDRIRVMYPDQRRDTAGTLTRHVEYLNEEMEDLIEAREKLEKVRDELESRCEILQSDKDHL